MPDYTIYRRHKICWVRFRINGKDYRYTTKERNEARAHKKALGIVEMEVRRLDQLGAARFGHLCAHYDKHVRLHKRSYRDDIGMLRVFLAFFKKETPLEDITPLRIEEFSSWVLTRKVGRYRPITKARVNRYFAVLKHMFFLAADWGMFAKANPVRRIKFFRETSRQRFFSRKEITKLWSAAREESENGHTSVQINFFAMFAVALLTGLRLGEIIRLKWMDYRDGFFAIEHSKNDRKRFVPVRQELLQILNGLPKNGDFIFDIPRKNSECIRKVWRTVKAKAGIEPSARFHDLRHTHATLLLQSGCDLRTLQQILGHSSLRMVEVYAHSTDEMKTRAVQAIDLPALTSGNQSDDVPDMSIILPKNLGEN